MSDTLQPPIRISIDMETASTERNAAILTLGAVQFGLPFGTDRPRFYERATLASNESYKRDVSIETMNWWDTQNPAMRLEVFGEEKQTLPELLDSFAGWCEQQYGDDLSNIELWSRGAGFDCEILQDACYQILGHYPFNFRKHMCQRTVQALMPSHLVEAVKNTGSKHHALHDAIYQADILDVALRTMRWN